MAFGKGVERLGETENNGPFYNKQFAATIAKVLGIDFTPDNGEKLEPIDPTFKGEPIEEYFPQTDFGRLPAIANAKPKGRGVSYTYHEGQVKSVNELEGLEVKARGVLPNFQIGSARVADYYGFQYRALLKIDKGGPYVFTLTSDDGSTLWIDGKQVIDNDGSHGSNTEEARMEFEAGYHHIEVKYFQKTQGQGLGVVWQGPGIEESAVPDDVLFHE